MRRIAVALAVFASVLVWSPDGHASFCLGGPPREELDDADAAVVGRVVEVGVPDPSAATDDLGAPLRWTIEVERDLKENVGRSVSFLAGREGSYVSGQFSAGQGERIGLILHRDGSEWKAWMCDRVDPEEIFTAAIPLPPARGKGLPRILAAGRFGAPRIAVLDERGDFTHYGDGAGDARVAVCPGERLYAEVVFATPDLSDRGSSASVEIRDARTMRIIRRTPLPDEVSSAAWSRPLAISCRDDDARDISVSAEAGIYSASVLRLEGDEWRTIYTGKARTVAFTPDGFAMVKYRGSKPELVVHNGAGKVLSRIRGLPSYKVVTISEDVPLVADPTGRFIAGVNQAASDDAEFFIADVAKGHVFSTRVRRGSEVVWTNGDVVVGDSDRLVVFSSRLEEKHEWKGWTGRHTVVIGDRVFGIREEEKRAVMVSAPYRTGPEKEERDLGNIAIDQLVPLSGERDLADRRRASPTWALYGIALVVVLLGATIWRSRRTDSL